MPGPVCDVWGSFSVFPGDLGFTSRSAPSAALRLPQQCRPDRRARSRGLPESLWGLIKTQSPWAQSWPERGVRSVFVCEQNGRGRGQRQDCVLEGRAVQVQFVAPLNARKIPRELFAASQFWNLFLNHNKKKSARHKRYHRLLAFSSARDWLPAVWSGERHWQPIGSGVWLVSMGGPERRCQAARKQHSERGEAQAAAGTVEVLQPLRGTPHADETEVAR